MTTDEARSEPIEIGFPPGDVAALSVLIKAPAKVTAAPGDADLLLGGVLETEVEEWRPVVEVSGSEVRFEYPAGWRMDRAVTASGPHRLSLGLGSAHPYSLEVKGGSYNGSWELGGLPITRLAMHTGASDNSVSFAKPNPQVMSELRVATGASSVSFDGLLNAGFQVMKVEGGAGTIELRFTGELRHDARAELTAAIGGYRVVVGKDVPAHLKVTGALANTVLGPGFVTGPKSGFFGGEYHTPAYETSDGPRLELTVTTALGALRIDTE